MAWERRDAVVRGRHRRLIEVAVNQPVTCAGFSPGPARNVWVREYGDVVQTIALRGPRYGGQLSMEWGIWAPALDALLHDRRLPPQSSVPPAHLRGGDHRLPAALLGEREFNETCAETRDAINEYLEVLVSLRTCRAARDYLAQNRQRLGPTADLRPLYLAGLTVLDGTPDASRLACRTLDQLRMHGEWLPAARRIRAAAETL